MVVVGLVGSGGLLGCDDPAFVTRPASGFFDPEVVDFGEVPAGSIARATTRFRNTSGGELFVRAVQFEPATDALAAFLADGGTLNGARLPAGRAVEVEIRFGPRTEGRFDRTMRVIADELAVELPIRGSAREERGPTPRVTPAAIAFDGVPPGAVASRTVEVTNAGDRVGALAEATVTSSPFAIGAPGGGPLALPLALDPGATARLEVRYGPQAPDAAHQGSARVRFDSGAEAEVALSGRSTGPSGLRCPGGGMVSFGTVSRGRTVIETVSCRVEGGWRPGAAGFTPGSAPFFRLDAGPRILMDDRVELDLAFDAVGAVGPYLGALELTGAPGATVTLALTGTVAPPAPGDADVVLRLSWNTPFSDFDLHLVRAGGSPFSRGDDCYFASKNPAWGDPEDPLDDPFLDRDDREGYGPETIALLRAREPSFDVYVQYHGFTRDRAEPTTVEVAWTLGSGAQGTERRDLLRCADWWHVGRIVREPRLRFERVDTLTQDYRARASEPCR